MKAKLIYNLPEELSEYEDAINGGRYRAVLSDVLNHLRSKAKYESQTVVNIEELRAYIYELAEGLDI